MAKATSKWRRRFVVVVATDGSPPARAAVMTAALLPWPAHARLRALVALELPAAARWSAAVGTAIENALFRVAAQAQRVLARRWLRAEAAIAGHPPVEAIVAEARQLHARAIVLGSRGHGAVARALLGSVSRGVVARAPCTTVVVRGRPRAVRRIVIGVDGSAHARRAIEFVSGLVAPRRGRVTVVRVVEPVALPSIAVMPARARHVLRGELARLEAARLRNARHEVETAAANLRRQGWHARGLVRSGTPVTELLRTVRVTRGDLLVVGARGIGGVKRLMLGSVANRLLAQSPVSVSIAK